MSVSEMPKPGNRLAMEPGVCPASTLQVSRDLAHRPRHGWIRPLAFPTAALYPRLQFGARPPWRPPMYHHVKKLMYTVRVDEADPAFGNMLLEQFGGANGELAGAMQYSIQGLNCDDPGRKDLLMDIGTDEMSHLEVVGTLARLHLKPLKSKREAAETDPLIAIAGGGGVNLFNSEGNAWTADYLKITGELDVDLRSNIAAEARAKIVYQRLINFTHDTGSREALQFLMTRWLTHIKAFMKSLESHRKHPL